MTITERTVTPLGERKGLIWEQVAQRHQLVEQTSGAAATTTTTMREQSPHRRLGQLGSSRNTSPEVMLHNGNQQHSCAAAFTDGFADTLPLSK